MYFDNSPLATTSAGIAERVVSSSSSKMMLRTLGLFRVMGVQYHSMTKEETGIHNTMSIDCATVAPTQVDAP